MIGRVKVLLGLALVLLATPCQAGILYSQFPADANRTRVSDFQASFINQQADNFTLGANATVTGVTAWGTYVGNPPSLPMDSFTIRFFTQTSPGVPSGTAFYELTNVTPAYRLLTGFVTTLPSWPVYEYGFDLGSGVILNGGTEYWLSVVNSTNNTNPWTWFESLSGDTNRWNRTGNPASTGAWNLPQLGDLAFALSNPLPPPLFAAVPEPTSVMLLGVAGVFGGLAALRRRLARN